MPEEVNSKDPDMRPLGEIVPLPFIELGTVLRAVKMLRALPEQSVLDNFNRANPVKNIPGSQNIALCPGNPTSPHL